MFSQHCDQIRDASIAAYPNEAAFLILADGECRQVNNCADDPTSTFRVSKRQMAAAHRRGLLAVVHSHPDYPQCPSEGDMRSQMAMGVPWGVIATDGVNATEITWFGDQVERQPLIGRGFVHGVTDCYSLIRDYYWLEQGIELPDFPRSWEWWRNGQDLYRDGVEQAGFEQIEAGDVRPGDMLWMQINSKVPSHGAIYMGGDLIMHHVTARRPVDHTRTSHRTPIHRWQSYITHYYRHREMT
ncbi:cell wall-associated NlpC family hydrolase [Kushneria sinocarnis]|uniref:Cell wall-associated NlpC family hydrolase n=1 Tax=Kushneria sinocarnis TaxID=595502 RepID=A0A420WUM1_9GAMM|nr:NlpC/P60 family protein [Kushneria sinocarnis]RKQ97159.1 cell wall-associated NlpC family hydrolase [Kushneria sinocarnis]